MVLSVKQFLWIYPLEAVTCDKSIGGKRDSRYFLQKIATKVKFIADAAFLLDFSQNVSYSAEQFSHRWFLING